jgi:site-specific recombinase
VDQKAVNPHFIEKCDIYITDLLMRCGIYKSKHFFGIPQDGRVDAQVDKPHPSVNINTEKVVIVLFQRGCHINAVHDVSMTKWSVMSALLFEDSRDIGRDADCMYSGDKLCSSDGVYFLFSLR